jgi:pimeloyl-ACP methyl ester carboxylesterase
MFTHSAHISSRSALRCALAVVISVAVAATAGTAASAHSAAPRPTVRVWTIHYTAHNGMDRLAYVVLPSWYGPRNNPPIPVVISPHGRGATGQSNAKFWGNLPSVGGFAVINPDGMGRRLKNFSYGYSGQIDDLARMPSLAASALPWLRIDRKRIYALGSSMGGQETLLLVARHPRLLAGAAAMDSVTDLSRRYDQLRSLPCPASCLARWRKPYGVVLQSTMSRELGGTPEQLPRAYAARSGLSQARRIADSGVPLQIWWSKEDKIVSDQAHQSGLLFSTIRRLNSCAPVSEYVGRWAHSTEMRAEALLPVALIRFGLLPPGAKGLPRSVHYVPAPGCAV